jgi:hypothetical protein
MEFEITRVTFYSQRKLLGATELNGMSPGLFGLIPEFTLNVRKNMKELE